MELPTFEDKLEVLGLVVGAFVVLAALGNLANTPWTTARSTGPAVVQMAGILLLLALGVTIVVFTQSGDPGELLSDE